MTARPWRSRPFLVAALALTMLFVLLLTAVTRLALNESRLRGEPAEGVIWFSSQGQYEAMRLADTALLFEAGRVARDELQLRFDLLDSRIKLFEEGQMTARVAAMGYDDEIANLRPLLEAERPILANLTPADTDGVLALHEMARSIASTMRDFANAGMLDGRDRQEAVRAGRQQILFEILGFLLATLVAVVVVAILLVRGLRTAMRAEAALAHEREVSRLHRAFTSVVSHQFRTPLSIIDSSAQRMLRRGMEMTPDELRTRIGKIRNACLRLTRLMESTLNAARLEQGEISFQARPCNLPALVANVVDNQPDEDQRRIELDIGNLPKLVQADTTLLEQAVQNLVSNALKYSPGDAPVEVRGERQGGDVLISVEDRGVGIPSDEIGFVTERFFRARTAEGLPGTGIGLNFVSQIMALHGGKVEVRSAEGVGSTFTLRFPLRVVEPAALTAMDSVA
ncbi:sensor histidine kinase [Devosia aurantiaca]|uniref:histidine kinase n=1 Tax=Devosia aurantiaca TaxID=2714858 RepID=A0A6M1SRD2_9HYPH|nr:HAMP domain-containing sensor histidine kinase [Devosia aurantiaca]NGP19096.1 HAMP domain-containing histidine kinase [Devosia aurantiaca]